ncbi:3-isopropylmalate dehydratase small subunit [Colwellia sp. MEBiC06753]
MQPFVKHTGIVASLDRDNVDTDAIMPKQYLKCIFKSGYGDWAFDDWRYLDKGDVNTPITTRKLNPEFELNQPLFDSASILLSRENFGCGSSREHAVWGIRDMGFKVIIATSFADIFYNNCFNNGILAITLPAADIEQLFNALEQQLSVNQPLSLMVDLEHCQLLLPEQAVLSFSLDEKRRYKLLNGLDTIAMTLAKSDAIKDFEQQFKRQHPYYFNQL